MAVVMYAVIFVQISLFIVFTSMMLITLTNTVKLVLLISQFLGVILQKRIGHFKREHVRFITHMDDSRWSIIIHF